MQDTYDPFSFLLSEIRAFDAGERENWDPYQRQHYLDVLLADEAEEVAWGRRHVSLVHGSPVDDLDNEVLDEIFAAWEDIAVRSEWARIGGLSDHHLTLTLGGAGAAAFALAATDIAIRRMRGNWRVVETACPSLEDG
jgi:hypothetical protein